jgi:hypothetical protein
VYVLPPEDEEEDADEPDDEDEEPEVDPLAALLELLPEELQAARPRATAVTATTPPSRILDDRLLEGF